MKRRGLFVGLPLFVLLIILTGCLPGVERPDRQRPSATLIHVSPLDIWTDDLDLDSLNAALDTSIVYYQKAGDGERYCFPSQCFTRQEMIIALSKFRDIMNAASSAEQKSEKIGEAFELYRSAGLDGNGTVLFTGYYEPILEGSLQKTDKYCYPLYRTPEETVTVPLGSFNQKYGKNRLVGRLKGKEVIPHYTRKDIDSHRSLEGRGLEIVWVADPVALFILHIQGSGQIHLPDGRILRVNYAQSNGRPFRGLTTYMVEKGFLKESEKSYQHMKAYLQAHPETRDEIMNINESYIFFRIVDSGPIGSLGLPVVAERSIATDPDVFPKGALAFIKVRKPVFNNEEGIRKWIPTSRFVFSHDAGGAIKGPGRVDLFCGTGPVAERLAGSLKEKGSLYFLAPRRPLQDHRQHDRPRRSGPSFP